ncbi:MAG: hypothetical protein V2I67_12215 [Thermoanaerobaculales bacterium]|jgi:uncharacterized repeat protein (TIGR01451 family)|nr:hypothetical protein [Thermoanaerobaculales bacterium]
MRATKLALLLGFFVFSIGAGSLGAIDVEEMTPDGPVQAQPTLPIFLAPPLADEELFVGTAGWGTVANPAYSVDVDDGSATQSFTGVPVGGAAYDAANARILFTSSLTTSFSEIWEWPLTGSPTQLGEITHQGSPLRIDGLAFIGGTLYGVLSFDDFVPAGIFSIDTSTWVATSVLPFPAGPAASGGLSGLAGDAGSGLLYAPDDNTSQVLSIDPVGGTVSVVAAYPGGEVDIDGMTFGNGVIYLVPDESGSIYPYDVGAGAYQTAITSPFTASDVFSGAAFLGAGGGATEADLALSLSCGVGGSGVTCTAMVNNLGPDDAESVLVSITLPDGLSYVTDSCSAGMMASDLWQWVVATLPAGASDSCTLDLSADAGATGPFTVVGTVEHTVPTATDPNPSNDTTTTQVSLVAPVPALSGTGVMLLVLGLIAGALIVLRRSA